jgi:hypothetical protein
MAAAYKERNLKDDLSKAKRLHAIAIICIIIFDFTSSFGVILSEIEKGDRQYIELVKNRDAIKDDIETLKADITTKKEEQKAEFGNKGRGPRYERYETEILEMETRLSGSKSDLAKVNAQIRTAKKSTFTILSEKSTIPAFWIEFVMFSGLMFLIYFVPLLTPWNVTLPGVTPVTSNTPKSVTNQPVKRVVAVKSVTMACIQCGGPAKPGSKYCSNKCKTRACRDNKRLAEAGGGV